MNTKKLLIVAVAAVGVYLLVKSQKKTGFAANDYRVTGSYPSYTDTPQMNWSDNALIDKSNVVYL